MWNTRMNWNTKSFAQFTYIIYSAKTSYFMCTSLLSENNSVLDKLLNMSKMYDTHVFIGGLD